LYACVYINIYSSVMSMLMSNESMNYNTHKCVLPVDIFWQVYMYVSIGMCGYTYSCVCVLCTDACICISIRMSTFWQVFSSILNMRGTLETILLRFRDCTAPRKERASCGALQLRETMSVPAYARIPLCMHAVASEMALLQRTARGQPLSV
jgi:hypothetical protein